MSATEHAHGVHDEESVISNRSTRSISAPPVAEHVATAPFPMYAPDSTDPRKHQDYYYYYAPRSHNPRLPVSYDTYENMYRAYQNDTRREKKFMAAPHPSSSTRRISAIGSSPETTPPASQAAFEAAVAAAGGNAVPSDAPVGRGKSLIDRIQEDFPRTPSPVYGVQDILNNNNNNNHPSPTSRQEPHPHEFHYADPRTNGYYPSPHHQYDPAAYDMYHHRPPYTMDPHMHPDYHPPPRQYRGGGGHRRNNRGNDRASEAYYAEEYYYPPPTHQESYRGSTYDRRKSTGGRYHQDRRRETGSRQEAVVKTGEAALLDEFRSTVKSGDWRLLDLKGNLVFFARDQHGSRFIQQKLETGTPEDKQMVFDEVFPSAYSLMTDVFGNYVVQKIFEYGTDSHRHQLVDKMKTHVVELALQMYGCRVVQKVLEIVERQIQIELISELRGHVLKCVRDQNANHVIQKCIELTHSRHLDSNRVVFIVESFFGHLYSLAIHPYGCRVLQRLLEYCSPNLKKPVIEEIHESCLPLVQNQYGNYVIQHVLQKGTTSDRARVIDKLLPEIITLSQHKYASNVVEKCLAFATHAQRRDIIQTVLLERDSIRYMMTDRYGNYVVQKLIDVADDQERQVMMEKIQEYASELKNVPYGKHLLTRLEKFTGERLG